MGGNASGKSGKKEPAIILSSHGKRKLFLSSINNIIMETFTIKKGQHKSKPRKFKVFWKPKKLDFEFRFDKNCNYDLKDEDQLDWNKLTGITFSIDPQKETVMVGWRYNKETDLIELNAYFHVKGGRTFTRTLVHIARGEVGTGRISIDYRKKEYVVWLHSVYSGHSTFKESFKHRRKLARRINPWFGGNEAAPKTISLQLKFK